MRKAKALRYFMLLLPLIIAGIIAGKEVFIDTGKIALPTGKLIDPGELQSEEVLEMLAKQANTHLPKKVDSYTKLKSVEGRKGELVYHYVKINAPADQFNSKKFTEKMRSQAILIACKNPRLRIFFAYGVNARYSFRGSDNELITEILVTPNECDYQAR